MLIQSFSSASCPQSELALLVLFARSRRRVEVVCQTKTLFQEALPVQSYELHKQSYRLFALLSYCSVYEQEVSRLLYCRVSLYVRCSPMTGIKKWRSIALLSSVPDITYACIVIPKSHGRWHEKQASSQLLGIIYEQSLCRSACGDAVHRPEGT